MRKFKLLALIAFMGLATSASAQFTNSGTSNNSASSSSSSFDVTSVNTDGWSRLYVSYNPSKLGDGDDDVSFKGFTLGWMKGIGLTQSLPLYLETGLGVQYRFYSDDYDEGYDKVEFKTTMLSVNIPVNLLYRFNITDGFSISPYFGLDFRVNAWGKSKYEYYDDGELDESEDYNLFSEDDMGDAWKRFQAGWHIGVGFDYRALHLGVDYGKDFNEISKGIKFSTTSITLGINF